MFRKFRTDPNYLTKYHLSSAIIIFAINIGLAIVYPPNWSTMIWYIPHNFIDDFNRTQICYSGCRAFVDS